MANNDLNDINKRIEKLKIQKNIKSRLTFNENEIWSYLIQIVQGLKYLHDNNFKVLKMTDWTYNSNNNTLGIKYKQ